MGRLDGAHRCSPRPLLPSTIEEARLLGLQRHFQQRLQRLESGAAG